MSIAIVSRLIASGLIALLGAGLGWWCSGPFRQHLEELWTHARSGSWETVARDKSIQSYLQQRYSGPNWMVHFTAGSSEAFPLDQGSRRATLQRIGHRLPQEDAMLRFAGVSLPDAYRSLLVDEVIALGHRAQQDEREPLERLARWLNAELGRMTVDERALARQSAQALLGALDGGSHLPSAIDSFRQYENFIAADFLPFEVYTEPPYDELDDHHQLAVSELDLESRCLAEIYALGGNQPVARASVGIAPAIMELTIVRRWLSEPLLDARKSLPVEMRLRYFGDGAPLRLVPVRLVVGVWDHVDILPASQEDTPRIRKLMDANDCCEVRCGEVAVARLRPNSVQVRDNGRYFGRTAQSEPLLIAIASRRRWE